MRDARSATQGAAVASPPTLGVRHAERQPLSRDPCHLRDPWLPALSPFVSIRVDSWFNAAEARSPKGRCVESFAETFHLY
jgi:hypothetical protein